MSLQGSVTVTVGATKTASGQPAMASAKDIVSRSVQIEIANGTGSGQSDLVYRSTPTINASANLDLDLRALTDVFGSNVVFARIKQIFIRNTSVGTVSFKPGASDAWVTLLATGSEVIIPANGLLLVGTESGNGMAVGSGTDNIRLTNNGATAATPEIIIIGTSA